jgi:hypothetical protein
VNFSPNVMRLRSIPLLFRSIPPICSRLGGATATATSRLIGIALVRRVPQNSQNMESSGLSLPQDAQNMPPSSTLSHVAVLACTYCPINGRHQSFLAKRWRRRHF